MKKGYKQAVRERLQRYGCICTVLYRYKIYTRILNLIYKSYFGNYSCSPSNNSEKTKILNYMFIKYAGQYEADVFHRLIPWNELSSQDKAMLENIEGWIKVEEFNCK